MRPRSDYQEHGILDPDSFARRYYQRVVQVEVLGLEREREELGRELLSRVLFVTLFIL
jgi:hypothetical protein